jgi:hypothetical protein
MVSIRAIVRLFNNNYPDLTSLNLLIKNITLLITTPLFWIFPIYLFTFLFKYSKLSSINSYLPESTKNIIIFIIVSYNFLIKSSFIITFKLYISLLNILSLNSYKVYLSNIKLNLLHSIKLLNISNILSSTYSFGYYMTSINF